MFKNNMMGTRQTRWKTRVDLENEMQAILYIHSIKTYNEGHENKPFLQTSGFTDTATGATMSIYMALT